MKEKLKKIDLKDVNRVIFGLYTLLTVYNINFSKRGLFIFLSFVAYAVFMFYLEYMDFVKTQRINANINYQKYLDDLKRRGYKEVEDK